MRLTITRTTPVYAPLARSGVFVQWDVLDLPATPPNMVFAVYRSESSRGPYVEAASNVTSPYFFDAHVAGTSGDAVAWEQRSLAQTIYYRVCAYEVGQPRAVTLAEDVAEVGDRLDKRTQLKRRFMQRAFAQQLRVGNGIPFAIAKLKHWGVRCTRCFDRLTKSVLDNDCPVCLSTGFVGGYYDPIVVMARKGVTAVSTSVATTGPVDASLPSLWMLDYPQIVKDDILIELRTDRRYQVNGVSRTELKGVPVHQRAEISELARGNTAYTISAPTGTTPTFGF